MIPFWVHGDPFCQADCVKGLVLFQFVTCWVREFISTMGYVKAVVAKTIRTLHKAVSGSVGKMKDTCMWYFTLITLLRI